jgi:hypothetical protein
MCKRVPKGIEREAAIVTPSTGLTPLAVTPIAFDPQQILQAQ